MAELAIALLGPLQVAVAGVTMTAFPTQKAKALLAYLAVEADRSHARERLTLLLWPDQPRKAAFDSLRQTLFLLRRMLPAPYLHTTRLDVRFAAHGDYRLDVAAFMAAMTAYRQHSHREQPICAACSAWLQQAAALYRGDFLAHFVLPDSASFEEWALLKREWLRQEALTAFYQLAEYHERQGDYEQAKAYAWRQIAIDAPREEAHRQLMRALALSGQRREALAQYETCCRILTESVDAAPAVETTALYTQIQQGHFPGGISHRPVATAAPAPTDPILVALPAANAPPWPNNLPALLLPLIGRETELTHLTHLLADPTVRLLTILGPGGIGKSHLALEVAQRLLDERFEPMGTGPSQKARTFCDGLYFVSLAALSAAEQVLTALAAALQLRLPAGCDPQQELQAHLRNKQVLFVLDNFEHLRPAVDPLIALLHAARGLTVLVTSRVALNAIGEQLFPLAGLALPSVATQSAAVIAQTGAVTLFVQSARRRLPTFALSAENAGHVSAICHLIQGMPLAILMTAAWIPLQTPATIVAHLSAGVEQSLTLLTTEWLGTTERHRSLRAVFDHSWHLLGRREQLIFPQLALFCDGFTEEAALAVTAATPGELLTLVQASLVQRTADGRYELHELIRHYAADKLAQTTASDPTNSGNAARDRHTGYYAAYLAQFPAGWGQAAQPAAAAFLRDLANFRTAWFWAVDQLQVEPLAQMMNKLAHFYDVYRPKPEGEAIFRPAAEKLLATVALTTASAPMLNVYAAVCLYLAEILMELSRSAEAERWSQRSLQGWQQLADLGQDTRMRQTMTLRNLGRLAFPTDRRRAYILFQEGLALAQSVDNLLTHSVILNDLADAAWSLGHYRDAQQWSEQNLALQPRLNNKVAQAWAFNVLGIITLHRGETAEAERLQRDSLQLFQAVSDPGGATHALTHLGITLVWAGQLAAGEQTLAERILHYPDTLTQDYLALAHQSWGEAWLHLGDYERARQEASTALALVRDLRQPYPTALALLTLGQATLALGLVNEAHTAFQESVTLLQTLEQQGALGSVLAALGYSALRLGDAGQAQQHLGHALQIALETTAFFPLLMAFPALALLQIEQGKPTQAAALCTQVAQFPLVATSRWFADVAGHRLGRMDAMPTLNPVLPIDQRAALWKTAGLLVESLSLL